MYIWRKIIRHQSKAAGLNSVTVFTYSVMVFTSRVAVCNASMYALPAMLAALVLLQCNTRCCCVRAWAHNTMTVCTHSMYKFDQFQPLGASECTTKAQLQAAVQGSSYCSHTLAVTAVQVQWCCYSRSCQHSRPSVTAANSWGSLH
jgi:hypothetical protein